MERKCGVLDGDVDDAEMSECVGQHRECVGEPAEDDDPRRIRGDGARSAEVRGERDPKLAGAARVAVAEHVVGAVGQHLACRCQPLRSGK